MRASKTATAWYEEKDAADRVKALASTFDQVDYATIDRQEKILRQLALYGGDGTGLWYGNRALNTRGPKLISLNVLATIIDALIAEVCGDVPRAMVTTKGGTYDDREKAKTITSWLDVEFTRCGIHDLYPQAARDAANGGLGSLRPIIEGDRIALERVHPYNILLDDMNSVDATPREIYIRRFVDRRRLARMYLKHSDAILSSASTDTSYQWLEPSASSDHLVVMEAWHLASFHGAGDGLHAIAIRECELFSEKFEDTEIPLAMIRAILPNGGFWGDSVTERLESPQNELNKLMRRVQLGMHRISTPRMYVQAGSVNTAKQQNGIGDIVTYTGRPPIFDTPAAMNAEVFSHIERLIRFMHRVGMLSEGAVTGAHEPNIRSAKAMALNRAYRSKNFIVFERNAEAAIVRLARLMLDEMRKLAKRKPDVEVVYKNQWGSLERIPWRDIDLDDDRMHFEVFPVNALSNKPAMRAEQVEGMVERGIIQPKDALRFYNNPDFQALRDRLVAAEELVEQFVGRMLKDGQYLPPMEIMNLSYAVEHAGLAAQRALLDGVPEDHVLTVLKFAAEASAIMDRQQEAMMAKQQQQMMMAPPPGPPGAGPPMPGGPPGAPLPSPPMGP